MFRPAFLHIYKRWTKRSPVLKAFRPLVWNTAPLIFLTWPLACSLKSFSPWLFFLHTENPYGFFHDFWVISLTLTELSHPFLPIPVIAAVAFMIVITFNSEYPVHISDWRAMCMYTTACSEFHQPFSLQWMNLSARQSGLVPERHLWSSIPFHPTLMLLYCLPWPPACLLGTLLPQLQSSRTCVVCLHFVAA